MWMLALALAYTPAPDPAHATVPEAPDPVVERAVAEAMAYADQPWRWNGRATDRLPGIDCMGLVFRAYGTATGTSWRSYAVNPSELAASGRLGRAVPGLDGVSRADLDPSLLRRGDVVYFLVTDPIPDAPLHTDGDVSYWPWHVGIYVDEGEQLVLNAHPAYDVVRMPLAELRWDALYVTRPRS